MKNALQKMSMPLGSEKHGVLWGQKYLYLYVYLDRDAQIVHATSLLPSGCANSENLGMNY